MDGGAHKGGWLQLWEGEQSFENLLLSGECTGGGNSDEELLCVQVAGVPMSTKRRGDAHGDTEGELWRTLHSRGAPIETKYSAHFL